MSFSDSETASHMLTLEEHFWASRRPPLHLRETIREGQRIEGQSIELFYVRPRYNNPSEFSEVPIARLQYVRSRDRWRIFWKRADMRWHGYADCREAATLPAALAVIHEDANGCFFG